MSENPNIMVWDEDVKTEKPCKTCGAELFKWERNGGAMPEWKGDGDFCGEFCQADYQGINVVRSKLLGVITAVVSKCTIRRHHYAAPFEELANQ